MKLEIIATAILMTATLGFASSAKANPTNLQANVSVASPRIVALNLLNPDEAKSSPRIGFTRFALNASAQPSGAVMLSREHGIVCLLEKNSRQNGAITCGPIDYE